MEPNRQPEWAGEEKRADAGAIGQDDPPKQAVPGKQTLSDVREEEWDDWDDLP